MTTRDVYLKDVLAESLAELPGRSPAARELLAMLRDGWGRADGKRPRAAVRGLTGAARAYLVSWLQRELDRPLLYVVRHGEAWESARDDVEYFRGRAATLPFPEPDALPYDPSSPHPSVTAERLDTLARLANGDTGVVVSRCAACSRRCRGRRSSRVRCSRSAPARRSPPSDWSSGWCSSATSASPRWSPWATARGAAASSTSGPWAGATRCAWSSTATRSRRCDASTPARSARSKSSKPRACFRATRSWSRRRTRRRSPNACATRATKRRRDRKSVV